MPSVKLLNVEISIKKTKKQTYVVWEKNTVQKTQKN